MSDEEDVARYLGRRDYFGQSPIVTELLENLDGELEPASYEGEPPNVHELDDEPGKVYVWEWLHGDDTDRIDRCMADIRARFEHANHIAIQGNVTVTQAVVQELSKDELRILLEMTEVSDDR